ncbi:hypothetical protein [Dinghuibacter silviterrae]|uniref:Uncharacterized protein n=1 Tax=Dinghuibacter silviterrae TaxID=1539049 RepID=A0A4R8DJ60_9BACT|nr:hypothetical protein [Dinghuibacter silviterrae]TDW97364.1 hypothetical protein EDB95_5212 [Dinghuibacter silviterrae]
MRTVSLLLTLYLLLIVVPACKKSGSTPPQKNIAYIYLAGTTDAEAFKTLLQANGCAVTLVEKSNVATASFAAYDLIVIDDSSSNFGGTGTPYSSAFTNWSTADSAAIQGAHKPLLLVGLGGMLYANRIKGPVDLVTDMTSAPIDTVQVGGIPASLFQSPLTVTIPANDELALYTAPSEIVEMYYAAPVPGVSFIARNNYTTPITATYGAIGTVAGQYGFWGPRGRTTTLTTTGQALLVNFVFYCSGL